MDALNFTSPTVTAEESKGHLYVLRMQQNIKSMVYFTTSLYSIVLSRKVIITYLFSYFLHSIYVQ